VAFFRMHGEAEVRDFGFLQLGADFRLVVRVEAAIAVDGEDEVLLVLAAGEKRVRARGFGVLEEVELLPRVDDAEVAVRIEALHEFLALIKHVALENAGDAIPRNVGLGLDDGHLCALLDGVGIEEGLVTDHAREREAVDRAGRAVVVAAEEIRIARDGDDLLEVVHLLKAVGTQARGDRDDICDALGEVEREVERAHSAERGADDGVEFFDAEFFENRELGAHDVMHRNAREFCAVGLAGGGVDGGRAGGAVTTAKVVCADDKKFVGVERAAMADEGVPPPGVHLLGPAIVGAGDGFVDACRVLRAAQGVEKQDGIRAVGIERAIGLKRDGDRWQLAAIRRDKWLACAAKGQKLGFNCSDAFAHCVIIFQRLRGLGRDRQGCRRCALCRPRGGRVPV